MSTEDSSTDLRNRQYIGDGKRHYEPLRGALDQVEPYFAPPSLTEAINMALYLRRPLLIEGEPGTGKTRLAYSVAHELGFPLKEIYIRSTSRAQDLLYTFDSVKRLYDIQERAALKSNSDANKEETNSRSLKKKYVELGGLGEAIILSMKDIPSVVLIDEIDKADIDFPNDLLLVLDRLWFEIRELRHKRYDALKNQSRSERRPFLPLILITSNREKNLPAPFLRRCIFHYIPFPDKKSLEKIVEQHIQKQITPLFTEALTKFWALRSNFKLRKPPSTSELLDWIQALESAELAGIIDSNGLRETHLSQLPYLGTLIKTQVDMELIISQRNSG